VSQTQRAQTLQYPPTGIGLPSGVSLLCRIACNGREHTSAGGRRGMGDGAARRQRARRAVDACTLEVPRQRKKACTT